MPPLMVLTASPDVVRVGEEVTISVTNAPCDPHEVKIELAGSVVESESHSGTSSTSTFTPTSAGRYKVSILCNGTEVGATTFEAN